MSMNTIYLGFLVTYIILVALLAVWLLLKNWKQHRQEMKREDQEFAESMRRLNVESERIGREFKESVEKVIKGVRSKIAEENKCQKT